MPNFDSLPDDIKNRPEVINMRLENHESRLSNIERGSHLLPHVTALLSKPVRTPLGDLPLPLAIIAGGAVVWWKPDVVLKLFGQ